MKSNQNSKRTTERRRNTFLKVVIRIALALLIVAMLLYCINLQVKVQFLEQLNSENELMYENLYKEYIEVHAERNYFEDAYDELYEYIYSKD